MLSDDTEGVTLNFDANKESLVFSSFHQHTFEVKYLEDNGLDRLWLSKKEEEDLLWSGDWEGTFKIVDH